MIQGRMERVGDAVSTESIIGYRPKKRMNKQERLAQIMEGRDGNNNNKNKGGGSTNKEKLKAKPFMLVKHSNNIQLKKQRSFSQQQAVHSSHIRALKGVGKKIKRKIKSRKAK